MIVGWGKRDSRAGNRCCETDGDEVMEKAEKDADHVVERERETCDGERVAVKESLAERLSGVFVRAELSEKDVVPLTV